MKAKRFITITLLAVIAMVAIAISTAQQNEPLGTEPIDIIRSEVVNASNYPPQIVNAIAGNLTQLSIHGYTQTKSWQGFFGNVTGTIILEDASGNRFYDWSAADPQGQVYASVNETITWTTVDCAPIEDSDYRLGWYAFYGMNDTDYDNINVTYSLTTHPEFYVGYITINGCRTAYTFVNNQSQSDDFPAVLLASDSNSTMIFTAMLENKTIGARSSIVGYDGGLYDFQLLVAENGQGGNSDVTPYYFWVEIS